MSPQTAQTIVLLAGGVMLAYAVQQRSAKKAYAAGAVTLGLSLLADVAPQVAGPFAILAVLYLGTRERLFGNVFGGLAPAQTSGKG